jgi:hypothetical protein
LLGLYAGRGTPEEQEDEKLGLMVSELVDWFSEEYGVLYGGIRCENILGDDPRNRTARCPGIVLDSYVKANALLSEYGFELSEGK